MFGILFACTYLYIYFEILKRACVCLSASNGSRMKLDYSVTHDLRTYLT